MGLKLIAIFVLTLPRDWRSVSRGTAQSKHPACERNKDKNRELLAQPLHAHMLLQFEEQKLHDFRIPAFTLSKGEIVVLNIYGGATFYPLQVELVGLLTGKTKSDKVRLASSFTYTEHIRKFRRFWFPITVGSYIKRHANPANSIYEKAFDDPRVSHDAKIISLPGNLRCELAIYATLSHTNNIIFDLAGVDPEGGVIIYGRVKEVVDNGGAAILIDTCDEFKNNCTTFVKAEYLGPKIPPLPLFSAK